MVGRGRRGRVVLFEEGGFDFMEMRSALHSSIYEFSTLSFRSIWTSAINF